MKRGTTICGGAAFVTRDFSFHEAYRLAEECTKSAKTCAKKPQNLINGYAGNWIDFQISSMPNAEELTALREKAYSAEGMRMDLRPYFMDGDNTRSFLYRGALRQKECKPPTLAESGAGFLRLRGFSARKFQSDGIFLQGN
ncbi:MAG: hypothetical protein J6O04_05465 [Selenomonadaceae bacterium]|nr:hypothetical protein [Selenomonadaceae bacterium]